MTLEGDLNCMPQTYTMAPMVCGESSVHPVHASIDSREREQTWKVLEREGGARLAKEVVHTLPEAEREQPPKDLGQDRPRGGSSSARPGPGCHPLLPLPTRWAKDRQLVSQKQTRTHPIHGLQVQAQLTLQRMQFGKRDGANVAAAPQPRERGHAPALQLFLQLPELGLHLFLLLQCQLPGAVGCQRTLLCLLGLPLPCITGLKPTGLQWPALGRGYPTCTSVSSQCLPVSPAARTPPTA